jgi:lipoprotein-anchoring transpeptidase ErfK/SrfK
MSHRTTSRLLAVLLSACMLFATTTAFATSTPNKSPVPGSGANTPPPLPTRGTVPAGVSVAGHDIGGLSEEAALSAILAYVKPTAFHSITAKAGSFTFKLAASDVFYTDADAMLNEAYSSGPGDITPRFAYDRYAASMFLNNIGSRVNSRYSDAKWVLSNRRLKLIPSAPARRVDLTTGERLLFAALDAESQTPSLQPVFNIPVTSIPPRITEAKLGRAILVVLSERYLRLYDPGKGGYVLHGYPCAVGQPAYPTPPGLWRIVLKRYMPTWVNPGDAWGAGMPAVIGPGDNNPRGTRAMNLDANGIRIHGTANVNSLGTAASHGCIRLAMPNVEQLYDLVVVGTPVYIIP